MALSSRRRRTTVAPRSHRLSQPSLLFQATVQVFVTTPTEEKDAVTNRAMAAIAGLFVFPSKHVVFDINRWTFLPQKGALCDRTYAGSRMSSVLPQIQDLADYCPSSPTAAMIHHLGQIEAPSSIWLTTGLLYLVVTLACNIAYFNVVVQNLANDYGWAGFNCTGMQPFLANTFNRQLQWASTLQTPTPIALDKPATGDASQQYNVMSTAIKWSRGAVQRQVLDPFTPFTTVITDLRAMNPCMLPWMATQYCWLDFNRSWAMAATAQRQTRCLHHATNAAAYLESGLRNIADWAAWDHCWGVSFDVGVARDLRASAAGRAWLTATSTNANSVAAEVRYWTVVHGLQSFGLQWQNYKSAGMTDAITIVNALGVAYPLLLSQSVGAFHIKQQTSYKLYWSFASDLWAIGANRTSVGGKSLLRASAEFGFANVTRADLLFENTTLVAPLNAGFERLDAMLGPFGA
ncbi:hypothetical protein ACHHYP_05168, partial [Achlya hypogyna]